MFTSFQFLMRGALACALSVFVTGAFAQVVPATSAANAPLLLPLNAKQQASLGVQVVAVQA